VHVEAFTVQVAMVIAPLAPGTKEIGVLLVSAKVPIDTVPSIAETLAGPNCTGGVAVPDAVMVAALVMVRLPPPVLIRKLPAVVALPAPDTVPVSDGRVSVPRVSALPPSSTNRVNVPPAPEPAVPVAEAPPVPLPDIAMLVVVNRIDPPVSARRLVSPPNAFPPMPPSASAPPVALVSMVNEPWLVTDPPASASISTLPASPRPPPRFRPAPPVPRLLIVKVPAFETIWLPPPEAVIRRLPPTPSPPRASMVPVSPPAVPVARTSPVL
jgi:hypothetical protein